MMQTRFPSLQVPFRLGLSFLLIQQSMDALVTPLMEVKASGFDAYTTLMNFSAIGVNMLLFVIGIWLMFGIRTRVVALLGGVLFTAFAYVQTDSLFVDILPSIILLTVYALAMPLVLFGGGRWSMYRHGWKDIL